MAGNLEVYAGRVFTVSVRFVRNGTAVNFLQAPRWKLYNSNDEGVLTGVAQQGNATGEWYADITIPETYTPVDGNPTEDLRVEFYGTDANKVERSVDKDIVLIDAADDFIPEGLVYFAGQDIVDTLVTRNVLASVSATIQNGAGVTVASIPNIECLPSRKVRNKSDVPERFNYSAAVSSYITEVNLGVVELEESTAPYLVFYNIENARGQKETVAHQLYWTNNRIINMVMQARNYLDKARLVEIDPTLQWNDQELFASSIEGMHYINVSPPQVTNWRPSDLPQSLHTFWYYATLHHALNMRYLAEGMTNFEFTGLNTTLNVNRNEAIQYKMDELKGMMDQLQTVKKSAISQNGPGAPDPTAGPVAGRANIGLLGIRVSPINNRYAWRAMDPARRFRFGR